MKLIVTGSAGFIGSALTLFLLERGDQVIGIDNHNDYYDPTLKEARLLRHFNHPNYTHLRIDLADHAAMDKAFSEHMPQRVVNLAAQAGVRHSIENPLAYVESNMVGFANILEGCRNSEVEHLVYASSSSVYGANTNMPFSVNDNVDHPLSLYAASKKSNELMAYTYGYLFRLPTTGLRFFTVYGPWGRPDMALFKFTKAILANEPIQIFNNGKHRRDFTYIDDIIQGIVKVLDEVPSITKQNKSVSKSNQQTPYGIYNIGSSNPVELMDFIDILEKTLHKKSVKEFLPLQPGDVPDTFADVTDLIEQFQYKPSTSLEDGIAKFVSWYFEYYNSEKIVTS